MGQNRKEDPRLLGCLPMDISMEIMGDPLLDADPPSPPLEHFLESQPS
jgi:hypothetical protein